MTIREANVNDLKTLVDFEQQIILTERAFDNSLKEDGIHYYNFQELLISSTAKVLVAEMENKVVGSGFAVIKTAEPFLKYKEFAYIGLMYVIPAYRGRGVNKQILETLKNWVKGKGIPEIRMVVYDENENAKNAYLKAGFKPHVLEMRMEL